MRAGLWDTITRKANKSMQEVLESSAESKAKSRERSELYTAKMTVQPLVNSHKKMEMLVPKSTSGKSFRNVVKARYVHLNRTTYHC